MVTEPKFYENWEDDNHCLQACIMMVLNTLLSEEVSWEEVNRITNYQGGLYTWPALATLVLAKKVAGTKFISKMDFKQFVERREDYLREYLTPAWFQLQKAHASLGFQREWQDAKKLLEAGLFEQRETITKEEIDSLLDKYLLIVLVDAKELKDEPGQAGHFVLVYNKDRDNFFLHDPGLPPIKADIVNKDKFTTAFTSDLILVPRDYGE